MKVVDYWILIYLSIHLSIWRYLSPLETSFYFIRLINNFLFGISFYVHLPVHPPIFSFALYYFPTLFQRMSQRLSGYESVSSNKRLGQQLASKGGYLPRWVQGKTCLCCCFVLRHRCGGLVVIWVGTCPRRMVVFKICLLLCSHSREEDWDRYTSACILWPVGLLNLVGVQVVR